MHPGIPTYFFYILHMYVYFQSHLHFLLRLAHPQVFHCKSLAEDEVEQLAKSGMFDDSHFDGAFK